MPDADRLGGDAELAGDLGLTDAASAQSACLETVTFSLCEL
jgi:hypothetical protein